MNLYAEGILAQMGINVLLAYSVHVMFTTNQLSLGNAGFKAVGAYAAAWLTVAMGWGLAPALVAGGFAAMLVACLVAMPILRMQGIFLVMATLAFGEVARSFFLNFEPTGGASGMRGPFGVEVGTILFVAGLFTLALWLLERSAFGRVLDAVRDDAVAASFVGIKVSALKIGTFAAGGFIAGVAGGLFAHYAMYIEPENFSFISSAMAVLFVILGGAQTFLGALAGAIVFTLLPEALRFLGPWRLTVYGVILVVLMILRPSGFISRQTIFWWQQRFKRKPAP